MTELSVALEVTVAADPLEQLIAEVGDPRLKARLHDILKELNDLADGLGDYEWY